MLPPGVEDRLTSLLYQRRWEYGPADGSVVWGTLRFAPPCLGWQVPGVDGRVAGFGHPNERFWRIEAETLVLLDERHRPTSRLDVVAAVDGRTTLSGPHLLTKGATHRLREVAPLTAWPDDDRVPLTTVQRLHDASRPLVVIFNALGPPMDGAQEIRWEHHRFTSDPTIDMLRFAEHREPGTWFLRGEAQIKATLRRVVPGRRRVILAGNSKGGYASLRYGQWLADEGLAPEIRTIALNPQTVLSLPHRLHLLSRAWDYFLPVLITDDVLALLGHDRIDLPPLLAAGRRHRFASLRHTILYDSDNPAECYYVGLLDGLPGIELWPVPLGLPHIGGIDEIVRLGMMRRALRQALDAPSTWRETMAGRRWHDPPLGTPPPALATDDLASTHG